MSVLSSYVGVRTVSAVRERAEKGRKRLESNRGKERKPNLKNKKNLINKQLERSIIWNIC